VFFTTTWYFLAELADVSPLSWMFFAEGSSSTIFTIIEITRRVVWAFLLSTCLAIILYIAMLTLYLWSTVRTLVLDANGIAVILAEEMRRAFVTVRLEEDLSVSGTEEVGRAVIAGVLLLLMGTLEAFSARDTRLVRSVEG
jgi:hypothetical protein